MAMSPASSPRLPSPPPMAEDQLGPKSPAAASFTSDQKSVGFTTEKVDTGASRRIRPGTKSADMPEGPPLVDISEIDSAYQLTEHLKALYHDATHPKDSTSPIPIDYNAAVRIATPPKDIDRNLWLYELCRFLTQKVNAIIIALFADSPPCSAQTCSEMRASEWQYLCAVHDPPKACCAIDYCCHTIDWAASTLTSQKSFPSRMTLGTEQGGASHAQMRILTNIFRRAYRIFAHAWFQHRDVFWKVENKTGLYVLFKAVCEQYSLIPEDGYTVPPEAEGKAPTRSTVGPIGSVAEEPQIEIHGASEGPTTRDATTTTHNLPEIDNSSLSAVNTTKRHRSTPSADLGAILDVLDEKEEEDAGSDRRQVLKKDEPATKLTEAPLSTVASTDDANTTILEHTSKPSKPAESAEPSNTGLPQPDTSESQHEAPVEAEAEAKPSIGATSIVTNENESDKPEAKDDEVKEQSAVVDEVAKTTKPDEQKKEENPEQSEIKIKEQKVEEEKS